MNKKIAYLGMDVHKNSITLVLFVEQRTEEEFTKKMANNLTSLFKLIKNLSDDYHLKTCWSVLRTCSQMQPLLRSRWLRLHYLPETDKAWY